MASHHEQGKSIRWARTITPARVSQISSPFAPDQQPIRRVACYQDRYVLRDGYHRAFGLLSRGISRVPAFVRGFDTLEHLAPAGMLPQSAWLGPRLPLLRDYHDDLVAESVRT